MKLMAWLKAKAGRSVTEGDAEQHAGVPAPMLSSTPAACEESANTGDSSLLPEMVDDDPDAHAVAGGLDFAAAIRAHQAWKGRLLSVVTGDSSESLEPSVVARDDRCVLGCWLHGAGSQAFANDPLLPEIKASHASFHQLAGQVLLLAQQGQTDSARRLLLGDYHRTSVRVQGKLAEMFLRFAGKSL